jgi:hypothetical protein
MPRLFLSLLTLITILAAAPANADSKGPFSRPSQCSNWDCRGGVICTCCLDDGCWICDATADGKKPLFYNGCSWDPGRPKLSIGPGGPNGSGLKPNPAGHVPPGNIGN